MRYFKKPEDLLFHYMVTFEDREYLGIQLQQYINNEIIAIEGTDDSISQWLLRTNATELNEEEINFIKQQELEKEINTP